jgi:hypothetical protein
MDGYSTAGHHGKDGFEIIGYDAPHNVVITSETTVSTLV